MAGRWRTKGTDVMGGTDDEEDESRYVSKGHVNMRVAIAKVEQRLVSAENKAGGHDEQFKQVWSTIKEILDRLGWIEKRFYALTAAFACGGSALGNFLWSLMGQ